MRIRANDPGAADVTVRWQGMPIWHCIAVDTEEGWADCLVMEDDGRLVLDDDRNPKIERVHGEFTVERKA